MVGPLEYHPYIVYLVRLRDALSGRERWLRGIDGFLLQFAYRQNADLAALNETRHGTTWEYAWAVEIDTRFESVSALALQDAA